MEQQITWVDWQGVAEQLNQKGFAIVPDFITSSQCAALIAGYENPEAYRKTVVMERYRFGLGEYKYFNYPLPPLIQSIRASVYPKLVPVANTWMKVLNTATTFPDTHEQLLAQCKAHEQTKATVLILKYGKGGYNTLHQDLYGAVYFPLQAVLFLNEPDEDFTGGEFVLTEQTPRAQSKAIVLKPKKGELLIFTTNFRPIKGSKGYYRVNMKHGVSEIHSGKRHTLGIIFHDALS
ncbi:2OG-Fe(II) oxygenase [Pedobacter insulae]|uniref:Prolyl 4-hydroxylase alpha subunit domain-containing protein n=1 Tax=Pedobacter insulae TaxID=414048 RepID=A0A1I3AMX2_9SPHI|nr:2OG-Fe(II) oxygenase [Pedobacter insulae]SFH51365.1 hypothetical protein SAMN04489864_1172 [Pedobacter insulae]